MPCVPPRRQTHWHTMPTLPKCRSGSGMPTLPPPGSMIDGRVGRRRARRLRWNIELARRVQEDRGMQSVVGIALLVVGVVLMIFGMQASASLGSRASPLFTDAPND